MPTDHRSRLARAAETAGSTGLDAVIVTPSADLIYLAGYDPPLLPRLTCLIVRPGRDPVLVVPRLEAQLATDAGIDELAEVRAWQETEDPYALVRAVVGEGAARVACSHRMWAVHLLRLQALLPEAGFVGAEGVMGRLRSIKDAQELDLLKRAARYADEALGRLLQTRLETRTERDVARALGTLLLETGNDEVTFTIVGSGPNGASPHHEPTSREILFGEGVLFVHRTGHGIGLEEHEWPYIVEGNDEPLRPGMCFSIEPGIYLPGEFGVRIEDIVTVTGTGAQRLNHATRELQVVR